MNKKQLIEHFKDICNGEKSGIEIFVSKLTKDTVIDVLLNIEIEPINFVQFNQLLALMKIPIISEACFLHYWFSENELNLYCVDSLQNVNIKEEKKEIKTIDHFKWGLKHLFIDCLLVFGNIEKGYKIIRVMNSEQFSNLIYNHTFDLNKIKKRGKPLEFENIPTEHRYLISEMVCKNYIVPSGDKLKEFMIESYNEALKKGIKQPRVKDIIQGKFIKSENEVQLSLNATNIMEEVVIDKDDIEEKCNEIALAFSEARDKASRNTELYLSMVNDLDVYVATSMRSKDHFVRMAQNCEKIFKSPQVKDLNLRYFDPTISAADSHEDKGLLECLMVKCCKLLIYTAGDKESYGKDAEAAMALSLGKPVIFYCENKQRKDFYKDVHPLSRLINFESGVAVGAHITDNLDELIELIKRFFNNSMQYDIIQKSSGYYTIVDKLTESIVRIQTDNDLLASSFWNYYFQKNENKY